MNFVKRKLLKHWFLTLFCLIVSIQIVVLGIASWMVNGIPIVGSDPALFQHAGWYVTKGAIPYIHIWDPKPPLVIETTSLLALVSRENMYLLHQYSIVLTSAVTIGCVFLVAILTYKLSQDKFASLISILFIVGFTWFFLVPITGFIPKQFMLFLGLSTIYLVLNNRPFFAGIVAALSPSYWLLGGIFAIMPVIYYIVLKDWRKLSIFCSGLAIIVVLVLLPIFQWNALIPMIHQVILVHFLVPEHKSLIIRLKTIVIFLGLTLLPSVLATPVFFYITHQNWRKYWWVFIGTIWFTAQILFFDFDNYPDLFPLIIFIAIIAGISSTALNLKFKQILLISLIILIFINPIILSQIRKTRQSENAALVFPIYNDIQHIYWNKEIPKSCHYRLSELEVSWMRMIGESEDTKTCDQFNYFYDRTNLNK